MSVMVQISKNPVIHIAQKYRNSVNKISDTQELDLILLFN